MRQPLHNTAKLPRRLIEELGISGSNLGGLVFVYTTDRLPDDHNGSRARRNGPGARKDRRKASRAQKKSGNSVSISRFAKRTSAASQTSNNSSRDQVTLHEQRSGRSQRPKPILKNKSHRIIASLGGKEQQLLVDSSHLRPKVPRETRTQLSVDDAEIAALEKALGVKGDGFLPKSFVDDGLDLLLEDLDDSPVRNDPPTGKRKLPGDEKWLQRKRQKALHPDSLTHDSWDDVGPRAASGDSIKSESLDEDQLMFGHDNSGSLESSSERSLSPEPHASRVRENPYKAPVALCKDQHPQKYVLPFLRAEGSSTSEDLPRLRRQLQGLLNRLSEANILSVLREIEKVYRFTPRQHVSSTLLDLLMGLLCDPTGLQDTFIILHAGFIAALYKVIGTDFGALAVQKIDKEFVEHYSFERKEGSSGRRSANLISLLAQLYNFQVISSHLIYDFIRLFLEDLTETSAELVLKIMRSKSITLSFYFRTNKLPNIKLGSGPQLRQDGASSLKEIIIMLQSAIAKTGEENLSVRTKFMVETMNNLKNNRMKTGIAASNIASNHIVRMKKILGTLNTQSIRSVEPLRMGLRDLRDSEKCGKWWLVGASYRGQDQDNGNQNITSQQALDGQVKEENEMFDSTTTDLIQLARQQRMNTDIRRSIFVAIMSATDFKDAHNRISKLRLKKSQELEIPRVLIHCAGAEESYNPFYALISRRVCSDKKLKMAFQFSLWNLFKRMGEDREDKEEPPDQGEEDELQLQSLVNLAKMFGVLIAEGGLGIGVLKVKLAL
jgi:nucleolar MIF4G domain-containing protein 1